MSSPRCERAPSSRSAPRPLVPRRVPPSSGRHDRQPHRRGAERRRRVGVRLQQPAARRQRPVLGGRPPDAVAPEEVRQRRAMGRAAERAIDLHVLRLPHLVERDPDPQVVGRVEQRLAIEVGARKRQPGARREHRRLDLQQADPRGARRGRTTAAGAVGERGDQKRIGARLGADLADDRGDRRQPGVGRDLAAYLFDGGVEARGVERPGLDRRLGRPVGRVFQLVNPAPIGPGPAPLPLPGPRELERRKRRRGLWRRLGR